ncbi:hypothetical protein RTP6_002703 [Batrachochytrium dendrobatidis]
MEGRDFLAMATAPVVAVITDTARIVPSMLMSKNNIPDLVHYLRPFGLARHSHVSIPDMHGNTIQLDPGHIRFVDLCSLDTPTVARSGTVDAAVMASVLTATMGSSASPSNNAASSTAGSPLSHPTKLPCLRSIDEVHRYRESVQLESITPWFQHYLRLISLYMGISEHETFNHPVACLVVVSTSDPDPVATARDLLTESNIPHALRKPYMDPYIQRLYLLIHDPEEAPNVDPDAILANMKRSFPTYMLTINTRPANSDQAQSVPDIWSASISETAELTQRLSSTSPIPPNLSTSPKTTATPQTESLNLVNASDAKSPLLTITTTTVCGQRISVSDYSNVNTFIEEFLLDHIISRMVGQMKEWEQDVASVRRGISGRLFKVGLKYFSGSKSAASHPVPFTDPITGQTMFPFLSPELIMRRLGDYAFMLRDYRYALSIYESVKKDFTSNERYAKYYAGIQEMMAVTSLMITDSPKSSIDAMAENAVLKYIDAKCSLYASRATMWIVEMTKEHNLFRDAAALLIRMAGEESDLKGALFLEQAAICFLRTTPPLPRKYTFHLILAGNRFSKCGLRNHAQRNYSTALEAYGGLNWTLIDDHIHFALGKQLFHMGKVDVAIQYFIKLLRKSRQSAAGQRAYLSEFLYIYQQLVSTRNVENGSSGKLEDIQDNLPTVPLPVILDAGVKLALQRNEIYKGGTADTRSNTGPGVSSGAIGGSNTQDGHDTFKDDGLIWTSLEEKLVEFVTEGTPSSSATFRRRPPLGQPVTVLPANSDQAQTITAVDEPVTVSFQWVNPLQVPIPVNNIYLECVFSGCSETKTELVIPSTGDVPSRIELPQYDIQVLHDVSLDAGEKRKIHLKIYPKMEGEITVLGVRYLLCGIIPTYRRFQKRRQKLSEPQVQQADQDDQDTKDILLKILVTPPMPVLDVVFHSFPETMLLGQVSQVALELNNRGTRGLKNLVVITSHPTAFCFGDGTSLEQPSYAPKAPTSESNYEEKISVSNTLVDGSACALQLPLSDDTASTSMSPNTKDALMSGGILSASLITLIPVWVRADKAGKQVYRILFMYQSESQGSYRILRCVLTTEVIPSLRVNIFTRTSINCLDEFILGVEMENLHPNLPLTFRQITSISPSWQIEPLIDCEQFTESIMKPSQTQYQYFRIKRWMGRAPLIMSQTPELMTTSAIQRLILQEDAKPFTPPDITMWIKSLGAQNQLTTTSELPLESFLHSQRYQTRIAHLLTQYPSLTLAQVKQLFTQIWMDDLDLCFFWDSTATGQRGHLALTGLNLCLYSPLPLAAWFGHMDAKAFIGRALFSATVRERKLLVASLLKSRAKDACPVRVVVECVPEVVMNADGKCFVEVDIILGNSSWMHVAEYQFEAISSFSSSVEDAPVKGSSKNVGDRPSTVGPTALSKRLSVAAASGGESSTTNSTATKGPSGNTFAWVGQTHFSGKLEPESQTRFKLHAWFSHLGMHDVNRWKLNVLLMFSDEANAVGDVPAATSKIGNNEVSSPLIKSVKKPGLVFVQMPTMAQQVYVCGKN